MRLFGSDRIANVMSRLGLEEGQQLEARLLNRSIESAQKKVEQHNFNIRKRTLEYDDVMNQQREVIYGFRGEIVRSENVRESIYDIIGEQIDTQVENTLLDDSEQGISALVEWIHTTFPVSIRASDVKARKEDSEGLSSYIYEAVKRAYDMKISMEQPEGVGIMERHVLLNAVDTHWQDYLRSMDALRQGVGLRAYGQRDPLIEYKKEAFLMFEELMTNIKQEIASNVFRASTSLESMESFMESLPQTLVHDELNTLDAGGVSIADAMSPQDAFPGGMPGMPDGPVPITRDEHKVGRNDPCPCGSGKKYKKCCGS